MDAGGHSEGIRLDIGGGYRKSGYKLGGRDSAGGILWVVPGRLG